MVKGLTEAFEKAAEEDAKMWREMASFNFDEDED
jgi:hypothetical protein